MYYTVGIMYCEERHGIFSHLPFSSPVTTDKAQAEKTFDYWLRAYTESWRGNKLIYDNPRDRDCFCSIREAMIECNEAAYLHGYYCLELLAYNHNPHE